MKYLFVFGYCTPTQLRNNQQHGWDDEDSYAFFVDASSEADALNWGREIADQYVRCLFERSDWNGEKPAWLQEGYASWIEHEPLKRFSGISLDLLPVIKHSEMPDFDQWRGGDGFGKIARQ